MPLEAYVCNREPVFTHRGKALLHDPTLDRGKVCFTSVDGQRQLTWHQLFGLLLTSFSLHDNAITPGIFERDEAFWRGRGRTHPDVITKEIDPLTHADQLNRTPLGRAVLGYANKVALLPGVSVVFCRDRFSDQAVDSLSPDKFESYGEFSLDDEDQYTRLEGLLHDFAAGGRDIRVCVTNGQHENDTRARLFAHITYSFLELPFPLGFSV